MHKKIAVPVAALLGALLAVSAAAQAPATDDTVLAKVGTQNVTLGQLRQQLLKYYGRNSVEQLINRSVMRQEAERLKVEVPDTAIAARLAEIKRQGGAEAQAALAAQGITDEILRERVRTDLLAEGVLDKKWPVRDADLVRLSVRYARMQTERDARDLIQEANLSRGRNFELLVRQRSIDKENDGLVQPDPFFRIDNPPMFKLADEAIRSQGLAAGQITRKAIQSQKYWLVLRLEKYLGAETLKADEREKAVQRIRAGRMPALLPASRRRYKVEQPVTATQLIANPQQAPDTVIATVTPLGSMGDGESIPYRALSRFLLESYGSVALGQLVERATITQLAAKVNATVSDPEVDARVATVKRGTGEKSFQDALTLEGITEEAWKERVRYTYLAEKTLNARAPVTQNDLVRLTARYIRVPTREEAQQVIQAAQMAGTQFEAIARQRSMDRNGDHFVRPRFFMETEQPEIFKALSKAPMGQVLSQPVQVGPTYLVLKLEGRFGAETLSAKEREDAIRRINTARLGPLLDTWRKEIKVEYPVPLKALLNAARA